MVVYSAFNPNRELMTIPQVFRQVCFFAAFVTTFTSLAHAQPAQPAAPLQKMPADTVALRRDISFSQTRSRGAGGDWMAVMMEMLPNLNPDPSARSREFLENVDIILHMAYIQDGKKGTKGEPLFDFYQSRCRIGIMKAREPVVLAFFLPGHIIERDNLPREPEYWAVEILVNDVPQEPSKSLVSRFYKKQLEFLPSFLTKSTQESRVNEGLLVPQYLAPAGITAAARVDTTIPFIREEGK